MKNLFCGCCILEFFFFVQEELRIHGVRRLEGFKLLVCTIVCFGELQVGEVLGDECLTVSKIIVIVSDLDLLEVRGQEVGAADRLQVGG